MMTSDSFKTSAQQLQLAFGNLSYKNVESKGVSFSHTRTLSHFKSALCAFCSLLALCTFTQVKHRQGSLQSAAEGEEKFGTYSKVHTAVNLILSVLYNQHENRQVFLHLSILESLKA